MTVAALRCCAAGLAVAALLFGTPSALAQRWIAPAYPERPALGPAAATGAVIWSHGRSPDGEDSIAATPPYMAVLRDGGWDTFRFNRLRSSESLDATARALAERVQALKRRGYRRVVLAGQSYGAFLSLLAADISDEIDAVIATAPAAYGEAENSAAGRRENATRLYPLLGHVRRARIMMFYFHADDFDPGGRGERSRDILAERHVDNLVIDRPPGLATHWAAATPNFARRYGACILAFLQPGRPRSQAPCDGALEGLKPPSLSTAQSVLPRAAH